MTERIHSLTVALAKDTREDDAAQLISAIFTLKGVIGVKSNIADTESWTADQRALQHYREAMVKILWPDTHK